MLPLLERPHDGTCGVCGVPPTNKGQVSGPGDAMAPRSRNIMQEQALPNLLPPFAPPELPHPMCPVGESFNQVDGLDSIIQIALRCPNPTMNGMHTNKHHIGLSSCVKALSKGRYGSSLIGVDTCQNERLLDQGIGVSENISRVIPDWAFPCGTSSSARYQSRHDAVFVRSIPGRPAHIDNPTRIPPPDKDIHLLGFIFCPCTNPFPLRKLQLSSMLTLKPGSKNAAQETQTKSTS
eukprot:1154730-Pelagomonas_calceolata.AAC.2